MEGKLTWPSVYKQDMSDFPLLSTFLSHVVFVNETMVINPTKDYQDFKSNLYSQNYSDEGLCQLCV